MRGETIPTISAPSPTNSSMKPKSRSESEEEVLAPAVSGDEAAFQAIYQAHSPYVRRLVLRLGGTRADDDMVQEVFIAAWRSLPAFRGESASRTWLHRLAVRVVWAGVKRREQPLWLDLDEARDVGRTPGSVEKRIDLERALDALPAGARAVLLLHAIDGYRYREIAERLDISLGTVKSQLHRARILLVESLS